MVQILFTSQAYIQTYTPIGKLVDWEQIEPTVYLVQDSFTQDILGTNFYNDIQGKYASASLSADELELMNRIKPAQAMKVAEQCVPMINWQLKNKGLMSQNGDYSTSAALDEVRYVRNEIANRAEFYAQRLLVYLCENSELFPGYTSDNSDDMKPRKDSGYDNNGMYFV